MPQWWDSASSGMVLNQWWELCGSFYNMGLVEGRIRVKIKHIRWCFFDKTSIVNNLTLVTTWNILFPYVGDFLGLSWPRFQILVCLKINTWKKTQSKTGRMGGLRHCWHNDSWWINYSFNCRIPKLSQAQMEHKTGWFVFVARSSTLTDADN